MARTKKYKLNSSSRNNITKKEGRYKVHKINKQRTTKNLKTRTSYGFQNKYNITQKIKKIKKIKKLNKTQKGGFLGYFKNLYQMFKFNKLVKQMNQADIKMAKDFDNYKNQTKIIKEMADRTAVETTNYIINYRKQSILKILKKDRPIYKKNQTTFDRNIEQSEQKDISIEKSIIQLDKELSKEMPNFNKLTKIFNNNAEKFILIVKKFSEMSNYRTKINIKKAKQGILVDDKDKLNKKYKSDIKEYEKNKEAIDKFTSFDDTYVENLNKKVQEIDDQIKTAQFYIDQFGTISKDKRIKTIELKKWKQIYEDIYNEMDKTLNSVREIGKNIDILRQIIDSIKSASAPIFEDYEHRRNIQALNDFFTDIDDTKGKNSLKDLLSIIGQEITKLRLEFIKETPSSMISIDYNVGELGTNFISEKLRAYKDVMIEALQSAKTGIPTPGGGLYFSNGGSGSRSGRGRGSTKVGFVKKNCSDAGYKANDMEIHKNEDLYKNACINTIKTKMDELNYYLKTKSKLTDIDEYEKYLSNLYSLWFIFIFHKNSQTLDTYISSTPEFIGSKYVFDEIIKYIAVSKTKPFDDSIKNALIAMYSKFNYSIGEINTKLLAVNGGKATLEDIFYNPTYDNPPPLPPTLHTEVYNYRTTIYPIATNVKFYDFISKAINYTTKPYSYTIEDNYILTDAILQNAYNIIPSPPQTIINAITTAITAPATAAATAAAATAAAKAAATAAATSATTAPGVKSKTAVLIGDPLLKNIIAALNRVDGRYKQNYDTVVSKTKEAIDILETLLKPDGDLKKLSTNIQNITQKLIELKYIEPKLISVKVKGMDTLYGQYSWILETAKDIGKDFPVLSETKALYNMIKATAERKILTEGGISLSSSQISEIVSALLADPMNIHRLPNITELFTKISTNENGMNSLLNELDRYINYSSINENNKKACNIYITIAGFIGWSTDIAKKIVNNINTRAAKYSNSNQQCTALPPLNPFEKKDNQSKPKPKNTQYTP